MRHYATLRTWPLQVYSSGIAFSPEASIVRRNNLSRVPDWLKRFSAVESNWPSLIQTLTGHGGGIAAMALSFDGRLIVSADFMDIKMWDATTGEIKRTLVRHPTDSPQTIESLACSRNGRLVFTTSDTGPIELWNADTGLIEKTLIGHSATILAMAISHDARQIVTGSADNKVRLWDVSKGAIVETLVGHSDQVGAVALSPDSGQIASGSRDTTIRLWEIVRGGTKTLIGHESSVEAVVFSHDGRRVASGSEDMTVRLWDTTTTLCERIFVGQMVSVSGVAVSPSGHQIASGSLDSVVKLWDTTTGESQDTLVGHSLMISQVAFLPHDQRLVSASWDGTMKIWDTSVKGSQRGVPRNGHPDQWNFSSGSIAFSPDGKQIASEGNTDFTVIIYDAETGKIETVLIGHTHLVTAVAFSADGRRIVSASDKEIRVWDVATGEAKATLTLANVKPLSSSHREYIKNVAFLPSGQSVASLGIKCIVIVWDPLTGNVKTLGPALFRSVPYQHCCALSRDGRWLASEVKYDERGVIKVYDIEKSLSTSEPQDDTSGDSLSLTVYQEIKPSASVNWFDFSWDSSYLATDCGLYMVGRTAIEQSSQEVDASRFLHIHDRWINYGQTPVLRIPPDFQVARYDVNGDQVALKLYNDNNVLIFSIDRRALLSAAISPSVTEEPRTEA